jgi:creatinine amidohydrolase
MADAVPGDERSLATVMADLRRHGVRSVSPTGVLGNPTGASAQDGRAILDAWVDDLVERVEAWSR